MSSRLEDRLGNASTRFLTSRSVTSYPGDDVNVSHTRETIDDLALVNQLARSYLRNTSQSSSISRVRHTTSATTREGRSQRIDGFIYLHPIQESTRKTASTELQMWWRKNKAHSCVEQGLIRGKRQCIVWAFGNPRKLHYPAFLQSRPIDFPVTQSRLISVTKH